MVKRAKLAGTIERALLGAGMSVLAFLAELVLSRRMRRRQARGAEGDRAA